MTDYEILIEDVICIICLEPLENEEEYKKTYTTCKCIFHAHQSCVDNWFKDNSYCIICRDNVEEKDNTIENNQYIVNSRTNWSNDTNPSCCCTCVFYTCISICVCVLINIYYQSYSILIIMNIIYLTLSSNSQKRRRTCFSS